MYITNIARFFNELGESICQNESGMLVSKPLTTFSKLLDKNGLLEK